MPHTAPTSCLNRRTILRSSHTERHWLLTVFPYASFGVSAVKGELERLHRLGVRFVHEPVEMGPVTTAVFDDTCGHLIQIAQLM